ncbi:terminal uridylyltransferase 7-like isoform X2 [Sycon ciliatum]|uniref:terminal uridylyltransferase 7-like isoform X2 n=1 Tax=Sycon ciliatum TaxID=27933 RepID=UPI0020A85694|eukprot:scpid58327/ scgid3814/ Terminal uridylyltransferase 7; Zinc finger CCHC domain-containing protein 6
MQTLRHGKALLVKLSPALQISGRCWHTCSYGHGTEWLGSSRISRTSTTTHTSRLVSQLQPCYCGPVRFASTEPSLDLEDGAPLAFQQPLHDLSELPPGYLEFLSHFIQQYHDNTAISEAGMERRMQLVKNLQQHLRVHIPDATLQVFGSLRAGICLPNSDIDLSFYSKALFSRTVLPQAIIRKVGTALMNFPDDYCDVSCVANKFVRVPLCKIKVREQGIRIDISCNNEMGVLNSSMIATYCKVDNRVAPLAMMIKSIAKLCSIANSKQGSLSSYTYIVMLIYYLQRTSPAVVPNLYQLYNKEEHSQKPTRMLGTFDTYFFEDIDRLGEVWQGHGQNKESLAELLFGFFKFYAEFDFANVVITPRLDETVLLKDSPFAVTSSLMNIEDPFRQTFNLGVFVNDKIYDLILRVFRGAHHHLSVPTSANFQDIRTHVFSPYHLMGRGQVQVPPKTCTHCAVQGQHFSWECDKKTMESSNSAAGDQG